LKFARFEESDAPALAELLADSSITRNVTSNGSSPERCLAAAGKRIAWYNDSWDEYGYGVYSLWAREPGLAPADRLLGWCGFVPPDDDDPDPEILYAIQADYRGLGLASEAARQAISWLFDTTPYPGVTAVIATPLNPGSVNVVTKLGMRLRHRMAYSVFLPDEALADEVVEYEIWRLAREPMEDLDRLVEQVAFRAGQLSTVTSLTPRQIMGGLSESLSQRLGQGVAAEDLDRYQANLSNHFERGCKDAYMDCYHVGKQQWQQA
jgi:RimJ/RimL family protein N-acetyltransferase